MPNLGKSGKILGVCDLNHLVVLMALLKFIKLRHDVILKYQIIRS